jgi:hypothetical protein
MTGLVIATAATRGWASTYVTEIPLDDAIYVELDTLNNLGVLDTYISEIRPISRIEAARLVVEAQDNLSRVADPAGLAHSLVNDLAAQLPQEVEWIKDDRQDNLGNVFYPLERIEAGYVFSSGQRRTFNNNGVGPLHAVEATPLLANDDDLSTEPGSNEVGRLAMWEGLGSFFTVYGEGAVAGPLTRAGQNPRLDLLTGAGVVSWGNLALSFGKEEMVWGTGYFGALSQGANAAPFPALRLRNIHPTYLPGFLRYLGPMRFDAFFGQLDGDRYFAHPWLDGQALVFKPLPTVEFGIDHAIMFGGRHNDGYNWAGFLGRATAFDTGNPTVGNTNSRGGLFVKAYFPHWRGLQIYQETLGEDNLTKEVPGIGRFLPFLSVSYQGGVYLPRLSADGRTTLRFEYAVIESNYSNHSDSLYWAYDNRLMGYPLGPDSSRADLALQRWVDNRNRLQGDIFYTNRAGNTLVGWHREQSGGMAVALWRLPKPFLGSSTFLGDIQIQASFEYVQNLDFTTVTGVRTMLSITFAFSDPITSLHWG